MGNKLTDLMLHNLEIAYTKQKLTAEPQGRVGTNSCIKLFIYPNTVSTGNMQITIVNITMFKPLRKKSKNIS